MDIRVIVSKNDDGSVELYFAHFKHWDGCTLIANILVNENQCSIVEEKDMITDKDVLMKLGDIQFLLKHNYALGNYLFTNNPNNVPVLEQLANNVIESIKTRILNSQQGSAMS
jgi:hypothetical protein